MGQLSTLLRQPEDVHTAINHFPLIGLFAAVLAAVAAVVVRNRTAKLIGLGLIAVLSLSAWPVYHYGEEGYDRVLSLADEDGRAFLKHHEHLAEQWVFLYFVTAGVAALGLILSWKWPRTLTPISIAVILLALASIGAGVAIAHAGGQIRHREFRIGPPPAGHEEK